MCIYKNLQSYLFDGYLFHHGTQLSPSSTIPSSALIQFSVARLNATLWAKDVKAPVLYCDPKNDSIDDHKKDAPEIFAEFQKNGKANEFHFIGSTEEGPFKTKGDNRSEGYNFYQSEAGSKVLLEFFAKHCN